MAAAPSSTSLDTDPLRHRWRMLALLVACRTVLGFQFQTLGSVSQPLGAELGLSFAQVGGLIGLFLLPGVVLSIPAGLMGRSLSDRVLVAGGLVALAAGGALAASADGYAVIAIGRLVCGAGFVFATLYFTKMVADWFGGREMATAMGLLVMTWPLGIAIGQVGHVWLLQQGGWRLPFAVASMGCLAAGLAIGLGYRSPTTSSVPIGSVPASANRWAFTRREWILTLTASLVWALFNAGYLVYVSFAPRALMELGYNDAGAAAQVSLASWLMIFSIAGCGQLADRTGASDRILYFCMSVATLCMVLVPSGIAPWAVSLAFGLIGAAPAGVIVALTGLAMAPAHRALGMGVFLASYYLVTAPAPALAGWLLDRWGSPAAPLALSAVLFALTAASYAGFRALQRRLEP